LHSSVVPDVNKGVVGQKSMDTMMLKKIKMSILMSSVRFFYGMLNNNIRMSFFL